MDPTDNKRLNAWGKIKKSFGKFADLRFKDGFRAITQLGAEALAAAVSYAGGFELYNVLRNPNLKLRQKIFPTIGYSLSLLVGIPAVIALIAGSATLLPPFLFAASVVCVIRNVGTYLEERAERNNLRKELINSKQLHDKIIKANLLGHEKTLLLNHILNQRHIYLELYDLRSRVIASSQMSVEQKQQAVEVLNTTIEQFSKGELQKIDIDKLQAISPLSRDLTSRSEKISMQLESYAQDTLTIKQINMPKSLRESIERYQFTQENIYSQDLPLKVKEEIVLMLEGNKLRSSALNDLYLRVGQHYLNNTALDQLKVQDDNRKLKLMKYVKDEAQLSDAVNFYQKPREVYTVLSAVKNTLAQTDFGDGRQAEKSALLLDLEKVMVGFKNDPAMSEYWLSQFNDKFSRIGPPAEQALLGVRQELASYDRLVQRYKQCSLFVTQAHLQQLANRTPAEQKELFKINRLIKSLEEHQLNSLQQFSSQHGLQFASPNVHHNHHKYNLIRTASDKIDGKWNISQRLKRIGKAAKSRALKTLFKEQDPVQLETQGELSEGKSQIQDTFKTRYRNMFVLMDKKQRLNYLEKSVPRRMVNIGLASVVALASLATTFLIPAIASPAAPAAATATVVIGAIATGLVVASALNSADLIRSELKGKMKVEQARAHIKEAIVPSLGKQQKNIVDDKRVNTPQEVIAQPILPLESLTHSEHRSMHDALLAEIRDHSKLRTSAKKNNNQSEEEPIHHEKPH